MTTYGWDASHYDGVLTLADLQRAFKSGVQFFTHKLGEGLGGEDATQGTALAAARDAGFTVLGGYWFCHGEDSPVAEADACLAMATKNEPWWKDFPGWFWQIDAETESGHTKPTRAWIDSFAARLRATTKKAVITYASAGQYGNTLAGLSTKLWNAHYGSNPVGSPITCYLDQGGDKSAGWGTYSGQIPVLLQFGSNVTIAGKTTCDANAFRGTIDQLLALITGESGGGGDIPVTDIPTTTSNVGPAVINQDGQITNPSFRTDSPLHTPPGTNQYVTLGDMLEIIAYEANVAHTNTTSLGQKADDQAAAITALTKMVNQILELLQTGGSGPATLNLTFSGTAQAVTPPTPAPPQASTEPSP